MLPTIRIRCDGSTKGDEQLSLNLRQMMRIVDPVKFLTSFKRSKVVRWVEAWGGDGTEQTLESDGINIASRYGKSDARDMFSCALTRVYYHCLLAVVYPLATMLQLHCFLVSFVSTSPSSTLSCGYTHALQHRPLSSHPPQSPR